MSVADGVIYIQNGENLEAVVLNRPLVKVTQNIDNNFALKNGTYSGLRAQATTKADVGLGSVDNYSQAHYDNRYLGITAKASDSDKLDALNSTQFLRSDAEDTASQKVTFNKGIGATREDGVTVGPEDYPQALHLKFAEEATLSNPPGTGAWGHLMTFQGWTSHNASYPTYQMVFRNGAAAMRESISATAWGNWRTIVEHNGTYANLRAQATTKADVGLGSVGNYSLAYYDGRYAQGDDFSVTGTYAGVRAQSTTKGDVGLGNVDNYSRADYDIRYAQGDNFSTTGTYAGLRAQATTKADVGLSNVDNYSRAHYDGRYLGITAKASDSDKLDALNSSQFLRADVNNTVVRASNLRFENLEATNLIADGDVIWDLSDGIYNQRSNNAYLVWDSGNDGSGSGLDADTVDGLHASSFAQGDNFSTTGTYAGLRAQATTKADVGLSNVDNYSSSEGATGSTLVRRNSSGDITARLLRSEYDATNASVGFIMTQVDTATNNYLRPSTPAQVKASLGVTKSDVGLGSVGNYSLAYYDGRYLAAGSKAADADKVDGLHGSQFLRSDVSDSMTGNLSVTGSISATGNITASSDVRIKTNVEVIPEALEKINKLSGYTYDRTDVDVPRQTGVIAQELLEVLPEAVTGGPTEENPDGHYSVAYGNLVGLLIESVKELNMKVEELEKRIK